MASTKEMREWLRAHGYTVGDRGRLHPTLILAYETAHRPYIPEQKEVVKPHREPAPQEDKKKHYYPCGWCLTGECDRCIGTIKNGDSIPYRSYCKCSENNHKGV